MTQTKHTPGPWRAELGGEEYTIEGCGNPCGTIAVLTARRSETGMADARIIASAPELREALEHALRGMQIHTFMPAGHEKENRDTCKKCGENFRHETHVRAEEGHPSDVVADAIKLARAALAKGETP